MGHWNVLQRSVRAGLAWAIVGLSLVPNFARAAGEMDVNIGIYPGLVSHAIAYVADTKGFYKEAGLNPTFIIVPSGVMMNSHIGSGTIDFGYQPLSNVGVAREQGLDQVFLYGNVTMPYVVVAHPDLKLPHKGKYPDVIADLKGMNLGVTGRGADSEIFLRVMAADAKLDVDKDITWIAVGLPTGIPALKSRRVDALITLDPMPMIAVTQGIGQIIVDLRKGEGPGVFKGVVYQGVVAQRKTAAARPKAIEAMLTASAKAYCWINNQKNFDEFAAIMKTKVAVAELTDEQFRQMLRENIPIFTLTWPAANFKPWNDMLLRAKFLKAPLLPEEILWPSVPKSDPKC